MPAECWKGAVYYRSAAKTDHQKGPGSPKWVLEHFWVLTSLENQPKKCPCENLENELNSRWIPTKRLKRRIRYETAAKMQTIGCKANAWIAENTIFVEPSLKNHLLAAVLCTNVHSHRCLAHTVFDKCYEIPKKITKNTPKKPKGHQNGPNTENTMKPQ